MLRTESVKGSARVVCGALTSWIGLPPSLSDITLGESRVKMQVGGVAITCIGWHCSQVVLLDVVEDEGEGLSLITVGGDGDRAGGLDLDGGAFLVVLAVAEPLTKVHSGVDLDQGDASLLGHGLNKTKIGVSKHATRVRVNLEMVILTVTNFLYLESSQSLASTAHRAVFLSRLLRTSFNPLTSPTRSGNIRVQHGCMNQRLPSVLVMI